MRIIITGASRGIGFEAALALAATPQHRILALSRNADQLQRLRAQAPHRNVDILPFDLEHPDDTRLQEAIRQMGGLDILINNAGLLINKPFAELTDDDWRRLFNVNFFGVVSLIRTCLPDLKAAKSGHILNISSMGGFQGSSKFPGLSAYSAAKAALSNLTECLAEEFRENDIRVNCLALGAVQTEMLETAFPGFAAPVNAQEMGAFVAYFATHGHTFFNGKVLPVSISTP